MNVHSQSKVEALLRITDDIIRLQDSLTSQHNKAVNVT